MVLNACNSVTEYDYSTRKTTGRSGEIMWIFEGEYSPPLKLKNDSTFISSVNLVLTKLELPKISNVAIEKEKLTGYRTDRGAYEWADYPLGQLRIQRSLDRDINYDYYDCIWKVIIKKR